MASNAMDGGVHVNKQVLGSPGKARNLGIITDKPKFPGYAVRSKREDSFKNWPAYMPIVPQDLVDAGLVYTDSDKCPQLGINTTRPKFPRYAVRSKREESFKDWPSYLPLNPPDMVTAGLVYTGVGDAVRCYHCGGGLRNWEAGDKPMLEHAKWYPKCPHVLLVKGQEYIDAAGRGEDMDLQQAASNIDKEKSKPSYKADIKSVAAQSCIEMGYAIKDVQKAMEIFIEREGNTNFKARDLLEIIMDQDEDTFTTPEGASNVIDSRTDEATDQDSSDDDEGASNVIDSRTDETAVQDSSNDDDDEGASNVIDSRTDEAADQESSDDDDDEETIQRMLEENRRIRDTQTCKICLEDMAAIIFLPCGHLVACPQCAPALVKCPVCRLEVKGQVKARYS